jgi:phytoene dehydrogenase-like protein
MKTAIVVGAGIGGVTAAVALEQCGWQVTVLERAAALGEVGAGISAWNCR